MPVNNRAILEENCEERNYESVARYRCPQRDWHENMKKSGE
jgi:hypothetical protein